MDVALIWATYFLVVFVVYLILSVPSVAWALSPYVALFIGLIVGLIYVLLWWFLYDRSRWTQKERNGMIALVITAAVLTVLDLFYVLWAAMSNRCNDPCKPKCPPKCSPKPKCPPKECDPCEDGEEEIQKVKMVQRCNQDMTNCKKEKVQVKGRHVKSTVLFEDE